MDWVHQISNSSPRGLVHQNFVIWGEQSTWSVEYEERLASKKPWPLPFLIFSPDWRLLWIFERRKNSEKKLGRMPSSSISVFSLCHPWTPLLPFSSVSSWNLIVLASLPLSTSLLSLPLNSFILFSAENTRYTKSLQRRCPTARIQTRKASQRRRPSPPSPAKMVSISAVSLFVIPTKASGTEKNNTRILISWVSVIEWESEKKREI